MSLDINLTNVQSIPIVVNANITAENNKVYHVIANATFTDPTPVEGSGYVVLLRNGVATIGGVSNGNLGTIFYRIFRGASWVTYIHYDLIALQSVFVPPSRTITINGTTQDLSADRTYSAINLNGQPNTANSGLSGALRYLGFSDNIVSTTETLRRTFLPNACTLKNFYIRTSGTQPATGSHVLTILKNGVDTSIVITIAAGSGSGKFSDTTNSESFAAGDEISIKAVNNATANSSIIVGYSIGNL